MQGFCLCSLPIIFAGIFLLVIMQLINLPEHGLAVEYNRRCFRHYFEF